MAHMEIVMAKKLMSITVRGKKKEWSFDFYADPKYWPDWEEDGLEVYQVQNQIPTWVVNLGLMRAWCFLQDLFNFKNPLKS